MDALIAVIPKPSREVPQADSSAVNSWANVINHRVLPCFALLHWLLLLKRSSLYRVRYDH